MPFHVSLVGRQNLSREIHRQIARAILTGRLRPGDRLSPSRELAIALDVSRMTVSVAYERLAGEGFVTSRQGAGTFVSELVARVARPPAKPPTSGALQPRPVWHSFRVPTPFAQPPRFDFRTGLPDGSLFPRRAWQRVVVRALLASEAAAGVYADPAGAMDLRTAIVRQIGFSRGVEASAENVVVTGGTLGFLVARPRCARRCRARSSSPTGTRRAWRRPRWPGSWRVADLRAISAR